MTLISGCGFDSTQVSDYLTGQDSTQQESQTQDDAPSVSGDSMASDAVLEDVQRLDTLKLAYQEPYGLNPYTNTSLCNRVILSLIYEPLFQVNGNFRAEPVLAQSAEVSQNGQTTVITLKDNIRFHSGALMTPQDVVYSYETAKKSDYYSGRFGYISSFAAQEDGTIAVTTSASYESVALLLDFPIIRGGTAEERYPDGTGPFFSTGSYELETFSGWWSKEYPHGYDKVILTPCDTTPHIRDQFEYGNVNLVCTDPNSSAYAAYHSDNELWSAPTTVMQYIGFNLDSDVYENKAIRSAVTYAVDRETIVAQDLGGFALESTLPASPLSPYYDGGLADDYAYDPQTCLDILEKAQVRDYTDDGIRDVYVDGYPVSVGGKMIVSASSTQRVLTANRIAEQLNAMGFDITVSALDEGDFRSALRYGKFDLYYGEVRLSPTFDLSPFFRSGGSLAYGDLADSITLTLCTNQLENSGNAYDLHRHILNRGFFCPVLFKTYAVYTTRGAVSGLEPALDRVLG